MAIPVLHPVAATPHGAANPVASQPHGLRRVGQEVTGYGQVLHQMRDSWQPSLWVTRQQITVPIPASSGAKPPKPEPRGTLPALKRFVMTSGSYLKHFAFPTLAPTQEVVGYVSSISHGRDTDDGDITFNVVPVPAYQGVLYYKGQLRPHGADRMEDWERFQSQRGHDLNVKAGSIHCEIKIDRQAALTPFIHDVQSALLAGQAPVVSVTGRWTYDPFHAGTVEIHPVREAKVLSRTGEGYPEPLALPQPAPVVAYHPD